MKSTKSTLPQERKSGENPSSFGPMSPPGPLGAVGDLDLTALALPQNFGALSGVKKVLTTVPVRKPGNQAYVRVHPDAAWTQAAFILQLKEDGECYFVHPALSAELGQDARAKQLYTYVTRDGSVGLWPVNLPDENGRSDSWSQSAHTAAELAQTSWVRLLANRSAGAYDVYEAPGIRDEPVWPERSFKEILTLAFKDRLITSVDHPVVQRLSGNQ